MNILDEDIQDILNFDENKMLGKANNINCGYGRPKYLKLIRESLEFFHNEIRGSKEKMMQGLLRAQGCEDMSEYNHLKRDMLKILQRKQD